MGIMRPRAARERLSKHIRECGTCEARTGNLCPKGELLARRLALAVIRRDGRRGGTR